MNAPNPVFPNISANQALGWNNEMGFYTVHSGFRYETTVSPNKVNINHGWKLHGELVRDKTFDEALAEIGLKQQRTPKNVVSYEIVDQDKYDNFARKAAATLNIDVNDMIDPDVKLKLVDPDLIADRQRIAFNSFIHTLADPRESRATSILTQFDIFKAMSDEGIMFKSRADMGMGRSVTIYGGTIENRDKAIEILEEKFGHVFKDVDDYINELESIKIGKNHRISQKFMGRFTTDYLPADYEDLTEQTVGMDGRFPLDEYARNPAILPEDEYYKAQSGHILPETAEELEKLGKLHPELGEALRGQPGYVSPYATIDDVIEQSGVQQVRSGAAATGTQSPPPSAGPTVTQNGSPVNGAAATAGPTPQSAQQAASQVASGGSPSSSGPAAAGSTSQGASQAAPSSGPSVGTRMPGASTTAQPGARPKLRTTTQATGQAGPQATAQAVSGSATGQPVHGATSAPPPPQRAASTGAPHANTRSLVNKSKNISKTVTKGIKGSTNLKILGAGLLVGFGAQRYNSYRGSREMREQEQMRRLEMQRRGMLQ